MTKRISKLRTGLGLCLVLPLIFWLAISAQAQSPVTAEQMAFAAFRNGQWDIYSMTPDGSGPRQLTNDPAEETDPIYSPDGRQLAYAARRNDNWDVYILDLESGEEIRLTDSPHYDGAPTWSPDGQFVAYESYQAGNMDIWLVDARGGEPAVNLTPSSKAGEFGPAWGPDGETIALSSWRGGTSDLYLLNVFSGNLTRLTDSLSAELWPVWHPEGQQLAFVIDDLGDREIFTLELAQPPAEGGPVEAVTWLGRTDGPAWSPDGERIGAIFHRWDGELITLTEPGARHQLSDLVTDIITVQGRLTWHAGAVEFDEPVATLVAGERSQLYQEQVTITDNPGTEFFQRVPLSDVETGNPWLADTVDDSFRAWRIRLRNEVGYDFLSKLSDAARDIASKTENSQYASWHKSGRAVDTLFDYYLGEQLAHEIVREDYSGETYWRVLLRCVDQSGTCGRPVVANPWNYSDRARRVIAPEQGGIEKPHLSGYYVDMTAMAREYGWDRISAYDDDEYSWTWHFIAFEYWHYQKRLTTNGNGSSQGGLANWYQAMSHLYPQETLARFFTWDKMQALGDDPHLIALKGVPLPLEMKSWWDLVEQ